MDAIDRVIAEMSPADTAAALRLLKVLEECRQMSSAQAEAWRRRITAWAGLAGAERDRSSLTMSASSASIIGP